MAPQTRPAKAEDLPRIRRLLSTADLPAEGVEEHLGNFLVSYEDGELVGVGGLEVHRPFGLVRSIAVRPADRGQGFGGSILSEIEARARELGLGELYLLTLTAEGFFSRQGFEPVSRDLAPETIRQTSEFRGLCPASAVLMRRVLAGTAASEGGGDDPSGRDRPEP